MQTISSKKMKNLNTKYHMKIPLMNFPQTMVSMVELTGVGLYKAKYIYHENVDIRAFCKYVSMFGVTRNHRGLFTMVVQDYN